MATTPKTVRRTSKPDELKPPTKRSSPKVPRKIEPRKPKRKKTPDETGLENGYRSGLEEINADWLTKHGVPVLFEQYKIDFTQPEKRRTYTPDFRLGGATTFFYVETKGRFLADDRQKHLWVKSQRPDLDIRFVFSNPHAPIYKGSKTTYAQWCDKHGFKWAKRLIPTEWIEEAKALIN